MTETEPYLEVLVNRASTDLGRMCPSERQSSEYGLVFPTIQDGTVRTSDALSQQMSASALYVKLVALPSDARTPSRFTY